MEFTNLKAYAAFILNNHLDAFVQINIQRVKEVQLPLLRLFSAFTEEQLYAYSRNNIELFLQSLAEGKGIEAMQQSLDRWRNNLIPHVPRTSIDVKDVAFTPHTRRYAFLKLLKLYTSDIDTYEAIIYELDAFYSRQLEMSLQTYMDIQHELLKNERDFLETILDNTADGISAFDTEGKLTIWNKALEQRTGVYRAQALGQNLFSLFDQYDDKENKEAVEKALKGERASLRDMPLRGRSGFYEADLTPLFDKGGKPIGGVSFSRDITSKKLAEEKLKKSEAIMAQAQSIAHVGSWEWDISTRGVLWSDELYRIFGYEPQTVEVTKQWLLGHIHPESLAEVESIYTAAASQSGAFEITTSIIRPDKSTRITFTRGMVVFDEEGKPAKIFGATQDVTQEKEAQRLIQGVLNGSLSGLAYLKAVRTKDTRIRDFSFVLVNDAAYRYMKRQDNLIGKGLLQIFPGLEEVGVFTHFTQVVETGKPFLEEIVYSLADTPGWYRIYAVKHTDGIVLSFEDITATKEAELKIQQEKEFSDSLIAHNIDGIVSLNAKLHYTAWNPVIEQMTGKKKEQVLGRHVLEVFPGSEHTENVQAMYAALKGRTTTLTDRKFRFKEGYYDSYVYPLYNNQQQITGVMSLVHDVSERKQNELKQEQARQEIKQKNEELARALQELNLYRDHLEKLNSRLEEKVQERTLELKKSETQLRLITDALPILISYIDSRQRYLFNNKAYEEWFARPFQTLQGTTMRELMGEKPYARAAPFIEEALQGKQVTFETIIPHAQKGERFVMVTYIPHIEGEQLIGFYAVIFDITERVKNEQALQAAFLETEQINRELSKTNELLDNFVYMAAHDLKSPVANLKLLSGMLVRVDNTVHPELYAAIVESVNRLDNTINGLVEVIEIQSIHDIPVKEVAFDALLKLVAKDLAEEIKSASGQLQADFLHQPTIRYVEAYLQSILKNLLSNSIKYRSNNRQLELQVSTRNENGYVVLTFSDNGMGMNLAKYRQHLFKPFTRFTNKASGKGLGLHLIKSMVEKNGGNVQVESEPEKGTTFRVYLKEY